MLVKALHRFAGNSTGELPFSGIWLKGAIMRDTGGMLPFAALPLSLLLGIVQPGSCATAGSESANPVDKSSFNLFNPTPDELLREMASDRPDKTEGPFTVDAGHVQFEMDLVNYTHDRDTSAGGDTRVSSYSVAPLNLRLGILHNLDLQFIVETWNKVTTEDRLNHATLHQSGFGDITPRFKFNLWGNDGGKTALAIMPFVKIPSNQDHLGNKSVEGGLIIPLAVDLPAGWGMGLMTQLNVVRDTEGGGNHPEFIHSVTFSHDIVGPLAGYAEFFSSVSDEAGSPWVGTVDLGLTYGLTANLQLDAGVNIGVTRSADDINPFIGLTFRY